MQRALSQLANGKTKKFVLTGADGNLGRVAADFMVDIAKPEEQVVITSYDLETLPAEPKTCVMLPKLSASSAPATRPLSVPVETDVEEEIPFLPRDHHFIEKIMMESGLDYNIQRNWLYMGNIPTLFAPSWKFCGNKWLSNSHDVPGAYVAREDCSRVFAALILGRGEPNKVYDATGPELVQQKDLMEWMCQQTGYKCEYVDMPDEELTKWWLDRGLPTDMATGDFSQLPMKLCIGDAICCGEMLGNGAMINTSDTVEELTGRKPLHFQQVLLKDRLFPGSYTGLLGCLGRRFGLRELLVCTANFASLMAGKASVVRY
ncbi:hypothetical protein PR001_g24881 [Phytophthora rubi]|uniref:NmrA-like domain-containing protein n=1 Tax=Phytophthora rubi TaxID=129364 RepID=A0A6A3ICR0_9STRA|nr:hypothetical protein PR001_g24881 [Phytophthora rubi]